MCFTEHHGILHTHSNAKRKAKVCVFGCVFFFSLPSSLHDDFHSSCVLYRTLYPMQTQNFDVDCCTMKMFVSAYKRCKCLHFSLLSIFCCLAKSFAFSLLGLITEWVIPFCMNTFGIILQQQQQKMLCA